MSQAEHPYAVKIETAKGQASVPIAFLTRTEMENFLQTDFKKLVEESGLKGVRVHIERAVAADYAKVLGDFARFLQAGKRDAA